jgi:YhgE/Pip-like protein
MTEAGDGAKSDAEHERPPGVIHPTVAAELRSFALWARPLAVVVVVMGLLGVMYMAPAVDPAKHLHQFPIVLVNADTGALQPGTDQKQYLGQQVLEGLQAGVDEQYPGKFDLDVVDRSTALTRLDNAHAYGAIFIPADFSSASFAFLGSAIGDTKVDQPVIEVFTNPGVGAVATQIATQFFARSMGQVNQQFGERLTAALIQQTDAAGIKVTGAGLTAITEPINVQESAANPLPDNAGSGLTAFYYALLLVLAGFTGTMIISALIDGRLGFAPVELGPMYELRKRVPISRLGTLVVKWWAIFWVSLIVSGLFVLTSSLVGMYAPDKMALWMFGVLVITGVGIIANAILSIFGSAGLLINLIFFVVLGLPTSGGTVPLEAVPGFFRGLAVGEPLHQAFIGARSILYFEANIDAGLGTAIVMFLVFTGIGLIFGPIACVIYDRKGLIRRPDEATESTGSHAAAV